MRPLEAQTILVTGATDGLGRGLAEELAAGGATVLVHGATRGGAPEPKMLTQFFKRGFTSVVFVALVRNKGRTPIAIEKVCASLDDGVTFFETDTPRGTDPLPHKLEGLSSSTWYVRSDALVATARVIRGNEATAKVRMSVSLGTGKTIHSDWKRIAV